MGIKKDNRVGCARGSERRCAGIASILPIRFDDSTHSLVLLRVALYLLPPARVVGSARRSVPLSSVFRRSQLSLDEPIFSRELTNHVFEPKRRVIYQLKPVYSFLQLFFTRLRLLLVQPVHASSRTLFHREMHRVDFRFRRRAQRIALFTSLEPRRFCF